MTDEQRALFVAVDDVLRRHSSCFEDLCDTYAAAFRLDAGQEPHESVKGLLLSAADSLDDAGMDWYASTKRTVLTAACTSKPGWSDADGFERRTRSVDR